jgi:hypothetical protein
VSTCPGSTVMTRMRVFISSLRSDSVNDRIAALLEQYIYKTVNMLYAPICFAREHSQYHPHRALALRYSPA